jgi:Eukaryotic DNA topoisomerase I, DNA binding fragment
LQDTEKKYLGTVKWKTLEHNGPVFPPLYERLPENFKFRYNGKHTKLSENAEEAACLYARMMERKEEFSPETLCLTGDRLGLI